MLANRLQRVRVVARCVLLALAVVQGWTFRHSVSPDGIAYLDLSDAVVDGSIGELVNGYWSPAYPALIGAVRWLLSATPLGTPYWEFALVHAVNVAAFALSLAAFEWFLRALDDAGAYWNGRGFATPLMLGAAYLLFGVAILSMISVEGTVPDLLLSAAIFAAFACALRLHSRGSSLRTALALGASLTLGALTKSIMFPLAVVVLATLGGAGWKRGGIRSALVAAAVFAVGTLPWVLTLSRSLGHASTGETGMLNYAWYVNHQQPPNTGVMPALSASHDTLPLRGIAFLPEGRGTNPLWYDPVRWHRDLRPRFSLAQQWVRLQPNLTYYVGILAPVLFALLVLGVSARWRDLQTTIARGAVVLVPSVAAFGAYALVYATSRYIAPFLAASLLTIAAAFPQDARLRASRMALAAGLALLAIDLLSPMRGRVFLTYGLAFFFGAWLAWRAARGPRFRWMLVITTTLVIIAVLSQLPRIVVLALTLAASVTLWITLKRAGEEPDAVASQVSVRRTFAIAALFAMLLPAALASWHAALRWSESARGDAHPDWVTARRLVRDGIPPGSKIAVVGNPESAGWARLNRYRIVAVVPAGLAEAFESLGESERTRILRAFVDAGATRIITRRGP
jgi:hypothetical protein